MWPYFIWEPGGQAGSGTRLCDCSDCRGGLAPPETVLARNCLSPFRRRAHCPLVTGHRAHVRTLGPLLLALQGWHFWILCPCCLGPWLVGATEMLF